MSKELDWCTCIIAIGGDVRQTVYRGPSRPVSVPEMEVLMAIHGESSITDIAFHQTTESSPAEEKLRLLSLYSDQVVSRLFPGRTPNMPMISGERPDKEVHAPNRKQRPSTKVTAAAAFVPPEASAEEDF